MRAKVTAHRGSANIAQPFGIAKAISVAPSITNPRWALLATVERVTGNLANANMRRYYYYAHIPILIIVIISIIFFFDFTAEDAYITYRYSENLVNTGALVYNVGEPINAMTSPLHAILSAALFYATGHTVLSNKLGGLLLLLASAVLVWYRFGGHPQWQLLALILILMPPAILLWTFGGLETPILLFLATITVLIADRKPPMSLTLLCLITLLAGLAFLTRYDSVLFFAPILIYAATKARAIKHVVIALVGGAILPVAWFAVSIVFYGDLLPTSFYVKTPNGNLSNLAWNGLYVASYLLFVGIIPTLVLAFVLLRSKYRTLHLLFGHFKSLWWAYVGLLLELAYGLTIATHHMMFSFRFFVPYLPAAVIIAVDLVQRASETSEVKVPSLRTASLLTSFLICLALFQIYQTIYTYDHSVNGISLIGEYRSLGVRDYRKFMQILKQEAFDIEKHWDVTLGKSDERPRIITYAAGMLPYTYRDSYIYEQLVSYRHCFQRHNQGLYADYLHILAPRQGTIEQQLPKPEDQYTLISSYQMSFDGSQQEFLVFYNPKPRDNNLTATINEPCHQGEQDALVSTP
jgi:arabinofuranosyltransferase